MPARIRVLPVEHDIQSIHGTTKQEAKHPHVMGWNVILLTITAGLGGFLFGYDTGVISGAVSYMEDDILAPYKHDLKVMHMKQEWVVSSALLGAVLACSISGFLSDKYGRKMILIVGDVCFVAGSLYQAGSQNLNSVIIGRILVGVGIGSASVIVPVYIGECSPPQHRGTLVTINVLMITIGQFSSYLMNYLLASFPGTWRWMVGIAALPALLQMVLFPCLPESPQWLQSKGQHGLALKAAGFLSIDQILQQVCGINTVMYYTPIILQMVGYANKQQVLLLSLLPAAVNSIGVLIGMQLVEKYGRRKLLLSSLVAVSISLFLLGLSFRDLTLDQNTVCSPEAHASNILLDSSTLKVKPDNKVVETECGLSSRWHILVFILLYLISFSPGLGPVPWAVNAEIYPLEIRSVGNGVASTANWIANFIVSQVFLSAVDWIGAQGFFCLMSLVASAGGVIVYLYLPETKGLSLSEIQELFSTIVSSTKMQNL